MAVLLMVGISVFTVPTPDFGPPILAMALWAAALLFYWRAVMESRQRYWFALGAAAALMLFTTRRGACPSWRACVVHGNDPARPRGARHVDAWIVLALLIFRGVCHIVLA